MRIKLQDLIKTLQGFSTDWVSFQDLEGEIFITNFTPKGKTLYIRLNEEEEPGEPEESIYSSEL